MGEKKVVYIAGPIKGVPKYWEAFEEAEEELTAAGYIPLSPSRLPHNLSDGKAMQLCVSMINVADAVYFIPGWSRSVGAQMEMGYCKYINKPHFTKLEELKEVLG